MKLPSKSIPAMFSSMSKHIPSPSHRSNILSTAPLSVRSQTSVLTRPPNRRSSPSFMSRSEPPFRSVRNRL